MLNVLIQTYKQRHQRKSRMRKNLLQELMKPVTWIWSRAQARNPSRHAHLSLKLFNPQKTLVNVRNFLLSQILYSIMAKSWTEKKYSRTVHVIVYWSKVQLNSSDSLTSTKFSRLRVKEDCSIQRKKKRKWSPLKSRVLWVSLNSNRRAKWIETLQNYLSNKTVSVFFQLV